MLIYFCAVLAGGPRYTLSWKTMHSSLFSWEPSSPPAWLTKGPLWGRAMGFRRQVGGARPSPPAAPSFCRQTQDVQGPDFRCRPRVRGAGLWAAKAPPVRRSRCGTGPKGTTALGATVQMGGSQVFPAQQIAYGRQRGMPTLTHTSHQKQLHLKDTGKGPHGPEAQLSNQRKCSSGKKRGTNGSSGELRAPVHPRPQGGSPAQAGGIFDAWSEEWLEPVGTLMAHSGVFPAHSEGPMS